jgi:hypothetical protein
MFFFWGISPYLPAGREESKKTGGQKERGIRIRKNSIKRRYIP